MNSRNSLSARRSINFTERIITLVVLKVLFQTQVKNLQFYINTFRVTNSGTATKRVNV